MKSLYVAIIIVSYNTREHLRRCLTSIEATARTARLDVETVVVDNASHDGSPEMVATEFSHMQLLASPHNLGFTGGNNLALHHLGFTHISPPRQATALAQTKRAERATDAQEGRTKPDYVLLLNPDAELTPGTLETLVAFMERTPQAAICGPRLCYGDGTFQHAAFAFPDWRQVALDMAPIPILPGVRRLWSRLLHSRVNGRYPARLWQGSEPFPVDFVLGAAMCVRGTAIDIVGGLDDEFFMYCEEMDWCLRMAQTGRRVYAVPAAQVIHHEAQSSRQVRQAAYVRLWCSRLRFFHKYPLRYSPVHRRAIHGLARVQWRIGRQRAWRNFARGVITGQELETELNAYTELLSL